MKGACTRKAAKTTKAIDAKSLWLRHEPPTLHSLTNFHPRPKTPANRQSSSKRQKKPIHVKEDTLQSLFCGFVVTANAILTAAE